MTETTVPYEFSRTFAVEKLANRVVTTEVSANPEECRRVAERFGLLAVARLHAVLKIRKTTDNETIEVTGQMIAEVTQQCVVTLDPIQAHINQSIEAIFASPAEAMRGSLLVEADAPTIEPILHGMIDLGEWVVQNLGTSLDPYPRKKDLPLLNVEYGRPAAPVINPFAKLAETKGTNADKPVNKPKT